MLIVDESRGSDLAREPDAESPVFSFPPMPTYEELVSTALAHRPEGARGSSQRREADVQLAYAKGQALPQADLNVQWQSNGLAEMLCADRRRVRYADAAAVFTPVGWVSRMRIPGNKFPTYVVGVTLSQPIGNETARARSRRRREQQRIGDIQTAGVKQRIEFESRNALQAYQSSLSRLYAARHARETSRSLGQRNPQVSQRASRRRSWCCSAKWSWRRREDASFSAQTDLNKPSWNCSAPAERFLAANNVNLATLGGRHRNEETAIAGSGSRVGLTASCKSAPPFSTVARSTAGSD